VSGGRLLQAYVRAVAVVLVMVAVAFMANRVVSHASLALLFLTGVLVVSAWTGLGPSLLASLLSFLALNFFFTQPYYTLVVEDEADVAMLAFFVLMAGITGNLAARMRREVVERRAMLERTSNLYDFSRRMASAVGADDVLKALADHVSRSIGCGVQVFAPDEAGSLALAADAGPVPPIAGSESAAMWSRQASGVEHGDSWYVMKLMSDRSELGMVVVHGDQVGQEHLELARSLCDQAAIALSRTQLVGELEEARITAETEQLRSALLSSVSHDLRTPLASIIGSTTSLMEYGDSISDVNRLELLATVVEEAKRLDRHIQNLLDMTRLGHGKLKLHRDWVDLHDIISGAIDRMRNALTEIPIQLDVPAALPLLWVHGALLEQALVNVLDNAIRHSPPDGRITLSAVHSGNQVTIAVCDHGEGIPDADKEKVFDMFYTAGQPDSRDRAGSGLGLAICRGIVAAHGGTVAAHDGPDGRGACIRLVLPAEQPGSRIV
jgi:two-component system, OmpR family, sensor histidine kinase KdpD